MSSRSLHGPSSPETFQCEGALYQCFWGAPDRLYKRSQIISQGKAVPKTAMPCSAFPPNLTHLVVSNCSTLFPLSREAPGQQLLATALESSGYADCAVHTLPTHSSLCDTILQLPCLSSVGRKPGINLSPFLGLLGSSYFSASFQGTCPQDRILGQWSGIYSILIVLILKRGIIFSPNSHLWEVLGLTQWCHCLQWVVQVCPCPNPGNLRM